MNNSGCRKLYKKVAAHLGQDDGPFRLGRAGGLFKMSRHLSEEME